MKYAVKTQASNPNAPLGTNPKAVWLKQQIDDSLTADFIADGWVVSESDNYMQTLLNTPAATVPTNVTPRQIRLAMVMSGINPDTIDTILATLPEPTKSAAKIAWEYSTEFQRYNPLIISLAPCLGLTPTTIDNLFKLARTL